MTTIKASVLVVEDDIQIRNFILYALKQEGFKTHMAGNAQSALSLIVSEPLDIVLLDMGLPDYDGMEVIKKSGNGPIFPSLSFPPGIRIRKRPRP